MRAPAVAGDRQESALELLTRLLSVPSEQTALMEREPAVTSFISGVVAPLVRAAGLDPVIDETGNLTAQIGTGQPPRRFLLAAWYRPRSIPDRMRNSSGRRYRSSPTSLRAMATWWC